MNELICWSHVFWDWNGTIVDDLAYNYNIVNSLLNQKNISPISLEDYRAKFCFPIKKFYDDIGFDCNDEEYALIAKEYQILYESKMSDIHIFDQLLELMTFLQKNNIKQYIFSSCNRKTLDRQLEFYPELIPFIDGIICQNNNLGVGKYDLARKWEQEQPFFDWDKVLIIGDTYYDSEIAKKLGSNCILINSGHQSVNKQGDYLVFENVGQLANNKNLFLLGD